MSLKQKSDQPNRVIAKIAIIFCNDPYIHDRKCNQLRVSSYAKKNICLNFTDLIIKAIIKVRKDIIEMTVNCYDNY